MQEVKQRSHRRRQIDDYVVNSTTQLTIIQEIQHEEGAQIQTYHVTNLTSIQSATVLLA